MLLNHYAEHMHLAKVISCAKYNTGNVIGVRNSNPIPYNCVYDVMLPYGYLQKYAANVISNNFYSQIYAEG